jgi:hypothetical protein
MNGRFEAPARLPQPNNEIRHRLRTVRQPRRDFVLRLSVTPFNGVCGNNRDASVYGDDAKSKSPGRVARALGQRNSLRTAIEFGADHRPYYP